MTAGDVASCRMDRASKTVTWSCERGYVAGSLCGGGATGKYVGGGATGKYVVLRTACADGVR
jgi:hypothetical protein